MLLIVPKTHIVVQRLTTMIVLAATLLSMTALAHASEPDRAIETVIRGELTLGMAQRARQNGGVIRVTNSPGGTGAAAMELAHARVIIDGPCNSACAWSFVTNQNACFTRKASFGFLAAHDPGTGRRMDAATGYWLDQTRDSLRRQLGDLTSSSRVIKLNSVEMARHYGDRACSRNAAVSSR